MGKDYTGYATRLRGVAPTPFQVYAAVVDLPFSLGPYA